MSEQPTPEALEARIMDLEVKASYTDDLLEQLNMTIYRQQQQIDALINEVRQLRQQVPELDAVFGLSDYSGVPAVVRKIVNGSTRRWVAPVDGEIGRAHV
jgi:SlyX protein